MSESRTVSRARTTTTENGENEMTNREAPQGTDHKANMAAPTGRAVPRPDNQARLAGIGAAVNRNDAEVHRQRPRGEPATQDWQKG
jgi:hypothetical protein